MIEQKEQWKDIPGYEGYYQVSNLGRVKSLDRRIVNTKGKIENRKGMILKQTNVCLGKKTERNYFVCRLSKEGKSNKFYIHQLVVMGFLKMSSDHKLVVDHIDNNSLNNNIENLQLITQRENSSKDKFRHKYTSDYVGVSFNKKKNVYQSYIYIEGKLVYLGCSKKEEQVRDMYINKLNEI